MNTCRKLLSFYNASVWWLWAVLSPCVLRDYHGKEGSLDWSHQKERMFDALWAPILIKALTVKTLRSMI